MSGLVSRSFVIKERGSEAWQPVFRYVGYALEIHDLGAMHGLIRATVNELMQNAFKVALKRSFFAKLGVDGTEESALDQFREALEDAKSIQLPEDYAVVVELNEANNELIISVRNPGGMLPAERQTVEDILAETIEAAEITSLSEERREGGGLGLRMIRRILVNLGLSAESLNLTTGSDQTTFSVHLPRCLDYERAIAAGAGEILGREFPFVPVTPDAVEMLRRDQPDGRIAAADATRALEADPLVFWNLVLLSRDAGRASRLPLDQLCGEVLPERVRDYLARAPLIRNDAWAWHETTERTRHNIGALARELLEESGIAPGDSFERRFSAYYVGHRLLENLNPDLLNELRRASHRSAPIKQSASPAATTGLPPLVAGRLWSDQAGLGEEAGHRFWPLTGGNDNMQDVYWAIRFAELLEQTSPHRRPPRELDFERLLEYTARKHLHSPALTQTIQRRLNS